MSLRQVHRAAMAAAMAAKIVHPAPKTVELALPLPMAAKPAPASAQAAGTTPPGSMER